MIKHVFAICAYKESPYLEDCILSLKNQSLKTSIIICTSTPMGHIYDLGEKYGIPVYVRLGESSLQADWNFAVETAVNALGAEYVTLAHQDDVYHRDYVRALVKAAKTFPDLSVFCTRYRTIDGDSKLIRGKTERVKRKLRFPLHMRRLAHHRAVKRSALILGNAICCPSCTYHITMTGCPIFLSSKKFALDWETLLRLADMPGRFICIEKELMDYRVHAGAETKKNIVDNTRYEEEYEVFSSIWGKPIAWLLMRAYRTSYSAYDTKQD